MGYQRALIPLRRIHAVETDNQLQDLASAARTLGVHYQTAYRWVRTGRLPAVMIDGRYAIAITDLEALRHARTTPTRRAVPNQSRIASKSEPLYAALISGDEQLVRRIARTLLDEGAAIRDFITQTLAPALRMIGQEWRAGRLAIGIEHRAAAIVDRLLGELAPNPRGRRRGTALVAAIAGDHHSLPTTMAAVALREDNWFVHHLGSDMPAAALVSFCQTEPVDLVVLTVTEPAVDKAAQRAASSLRSLGTPVIVGGPGRTLDELLAGARAASRASRGQPTRKPKGAPVGRR